MAEQIMSLVLNKTKRTVSVHAHRTCIKVKFIFRLIKKKILVINLIKAHKFK